MPPSFITGLRPVMGIQQRKSSLQVVILKSHFNQHCQIQAFNHYESTFAAAFNFELQQIIK